MQRMRQEYIDYWKIHEPIPVGMSKIGKYGRWHIVYSNGTSKKVSWLWSIVPDRYVWYSTKGITLIINRR